MQYLCSQTKISEQERGSTLNIPNLTPTFPATCHPPSPRNCGSMYWRCHVLERGPWQGRHSDGRKSSEHVVRSGKGLSWSLQRVVWLGCLKRHRVRHGKIGPWGQTLAPTA